MKKRLLVRITIAAGSVIALALIAGGILFYSKVQSGLPTTHTSSSQFSSLRAKKSFLEQYVRFRRSYETLEFDLRYVNGSSGMVSSPSEWDIVIATVVPEEEMEVWIQGLKKTQPSGVVQWLRQTPVKTKPNETIEWFSRSGEAPEANRESDTVVGIIRSQRLILYRNYAI